MGQSGIRNIELRITADKCREREKPHKAMQQDHRYEWEEKEKREEGACSASWEIY